MEGEKEAERHERKSEKREESWILTWFKSIGGKGWQKGMERKDEEDRATRGAGQEWGEGGRGSFNTSVISYKSFSSEGRTSLVWFNS